MRIFRNLFCARILLTFGFYGGLAYVTSTPINGFWLPHGRIAHSFCRTYSRQTFAPVGLAFYRPTDMGPSGPFYEDPLSQILFSSIAPSPHGPVIF